MAGRGGAGARSSTRTTFVPAESLAGELEHVRKWPAEHWHLAFQGQLRTVSDADAAAAARADRGRGAASGAAPGDPRAPLHRRGGERAAAAGRADAAQRCARRATGSPTPRLHEALASAAPANGGGDAGPRGRRGVPRGPRRCSPSSPELGIVVRDIDRGLIDFPAIVDGREVYLCWQLGEDEIAFWHDLESGFGGRQPLD